MSLLCRISGDRSSLSSFVPMDEVGDMELSSEELSSFSLVSELEEELVLDKEKISSSLLLGISRFGLETLSFLRRAFPWNVKSDDRTPSFGRQGLAMA